MASEVVEVPISSIQIPQVRASALFDPEKMQELIDSIKENGLLNPITVRPIGDGNFMLIAGLHRLEACKKLGWEKIPARILNVDEKTAILLNLTENSARADADPVSVAYTIKHLLELGLSTQEIAKRLGHTERWVKDYLMITELPEVYQNAFRTKQLKIGHLRAVMRLPNAYEIDAALKTTIDLGWDVQTLENYVENRLLSLQKEAEMVRMGLPTEELPPAGSEVYAQYKQCLACGRMVPTRELYYWIICNDCAQMIKWINSMFEDPKTAMQAIYEGLRLYLQKKKQEELLSGSGQPPSQQQYYGYSSPG